MDRTDLDALLDEHGTWPDVAAALELALEEVASDEARAAVQSQLGRVHLRHLNDPATALPLLEAAVDADITDIAAIDGLGDLLAAREAWDELTGLLLDAIDANERPTDQARWFAALIDAYHRGLGDPDKALVVLEGALARLTGAPPILAAAEALAHADGLRARVIEQLTLQLGPTAERLGSAGTAQVHRTLGLLLAADPNDADRALLHLEQASAELPDDDEVRSTLAGLLTESGDWDALVAQHERALAATEDAEQRLAALHALETLHREQRQDLRAAAATRVQRISEGEDDDEAWTTLGEYFTRLEDWDGLLPTLETRLERAVDAGERAELRRSIARLLRDRLGDVEGAGEVWRALWETDPSDAEAEQAVYDAAQAAKETDTVLRILDARIERTQAHEERSALWMARATAQRANDDLAGTLTSLREAHRLHPSDDATFAAFAEVLGHAEAWAELAEVWEARARDESQPVDVRRAAWQVAGRRHLAMLDDPAQAIRCFEEAIALEGVDPTLLQELAGLYERQGDAEAAMRTLHRLAEVSEGDARRDALLAEARLREADGGAAWETALRAVLDVDPGHIETLESLAGAQSARGAWDEAHETLHQVLARVLDPSPRADALARIGQIEREQLDRTDAAIVTLEEATTLVPGHALASSLLVDIWTERETWERALPLIEQLLAQASDDDPTWPLLQLHRAQAAEALHQVEQALDAWQAVRRLAPDDPHARRAIPRLLARAGRHEEAVAAAEAVIEEEGLLLDEADEKELLEIIAPACVALDRVEDAQRAYQRLQRLDPWHADALRFLSRHAGESDDALESRRDAVERLLSMTDEPTERFRLLVELGDAFAPTNETAAIGAYRDAIALDPDSRAVLAKLLDLFTRTEQWLRAAEVLGRLHELETSVERKIRLLMTLAALFRDEIRDPVESARFLEMVLDHDRSRSDAFDELQSLLADAQEWERLEKAYRRMIARTDESEVVLRYRLLLSLARVYETRLHRHEEAVAAYRAASLLQPREVEPLIRIAEIMPPEGKPELQHIAEHRAILALVPDRAASYHALFELHERRREYDAAWRLAAALRVLGLAEPREHSFFDALRPETLVLARRPLEREDWPLVQHPLLDFLLTTLFDALGTSALRAFAQDPAQLGLTDDDLLDLEADHPITNLVRYLSNVLGLGTVDCYYLERAKGAATANFQRPSLLIGADIAGVVPGRREVFRLTRAMLGLRPEFRLAAAYPASAALKGWVHGTLAAWTQQIIPQPDEQTVRTIATQVQALPPAALERIGVAVNGLLASHTDLNVSAWLRGVEHTMNRISLLLCGDLERAIEAVRQETAPLGELGESERIRDLVVYSMTDEYGELRGRLRIAIGQ